jgi:hypothetical protein
MGVAGANTDSFILFENGVMRNRLVLLATPWMKRTANVGSR